MEIKDCKTRERLTNIFLLEPVPFSSRREINWRTIKYLFFGTLTLCIIGLLFYPTRQSELRIDLQEDAPGTKDRVSSLNSSETALRQLEQAHLNVQGVPQNFEYLFKDSSSEAQTRPSYKSNDSAMIVPRPEVESRYNLPPGSRIRLRLQDRAVVTTESIPVIAEVIENVIHEGKIFIRKGARVYGEAECGNSDRARINLRTLRTAGAPERPFRATGFDNNGQLGLKGSVRNRATKQLIGMSITRMIGAYAVGSMQTGGIVGNPGGNENGWKNALAEAAKNQGETWAEDLKKDNRQIELAAGTEFFAVLREPLKDLGGDLR